MTHFTQLGLSGKPDRKPETKPQAKTSNTPEDPRSNQKQPTKKQKTAALVGSLMATALLGVFVFESGCSKESSKTAAVNPPSPSVSQPSTPIANVLTTIAPVATQPPAKKTSRQRKLSASTYTNPAYGVSFRYPKYDNLMEGDEANLELDGLGPVEMNFVEPGGTTISAVELPRKLYGGTNFNTAFFDVSVNPKMTSEECEQFAFPEMADPKTDPVAISKTKIGPTEFDAVEAFAETESNQADQKFYHVFQNGSCYEFTLGLETAAETNKDDAKPAAKSVDSNEIFRQLNWMLSTVKIQSATPPEKTTPQVAADMPVAPTRAAISEAH